MTKINCIDSDLVEDISNNEMFIGYLVHLEDPRCVMLVTQPGFMQKTPIQFDYDSGHFYRSKDSDIEIVVVKWLSDDPYTDEEINSLLLSAATHLEIHLQTLYEEELKEAFPDDET